jgi:cytochrome c oxidase assembly protein subunit 15
MVSTNHASLACPDWPTCNGRWLPELAGLVGLQMAHRLGAYLLIALLGWVALRSGSAPDATTRNLGRSLFLLVLAQGAIGVANVLLGIPVWVSALHLGNAALMLALSLVGAFRLAAMPVAGRAADAPLDPPQAGYRPKAGANVQRAVAR